MKKSELLGFIDKYHLNGKVDSVIWESTKEGLRTQFISGDKNLLGSVNIPDTVFGENKIGVYVTSQLKRMLNILEEDIDIKFEPIDDRVPAATFSDKAKTINFMLSNINTIPSVPPLRAIPDFELSLVVDAQFVDTFIKGKAALPDALTFVIRTKDGKSELVIGNAVDGYSNTVVFDVNTTNGGHVSEMSKVTFDADIFLEILKANRGCENVTYNVSSKGVSHIKFEYENGCCSNYYLVSMEGIG